MPADTDPDMAFVLVQHLEPDRKSVIKDPPFSKIDLISCRNLLIYMNDELQKTVVPLFHYALNPRCSKPPRRFLRLQGNRIHRTDGRTGLYLAPTPGIAGIPNVIMMAREGLQKDLSQALQSINEDKSTYNQ